MANYDNFLAAEQDKAYGGDMPHNHELCETCFHDRPKAEMYTWGRGYICARCIPKCEHISNGVRCKRPVLRDFMCTRCEYAYVLRQMRESSDDPELLQAYREDMSELLRYAADHRPEELRAALKEVQ